MTNYVTVNYGSCDHRRGSTYDGEVCYAELSDAVDAYEFSFVAVPEQPKAGVVKGRESEIATPAKIAALEEELGQLERQMLVSAGSGRDYLKSKHAIVEDEYLKLKAWYTENGSAKENVKNALTAYDAARSMIAEYEALENAVFAEDYGQIRRTYLSNEYDALLSLIGDLSSIPLSDTSSVASMIELILAKIGDVSKLDTEDIVSAISEL